MAETKGSGDSVRPDFREPDRRPPSFTAIPKHIAIVMDGNGRWANQRGLPRVEGHRAGEAALLDVVAGALEAGVKELTVFAFSTENWKRSPDEVRFLLGFNKEVLRRRRDQLNAWGVRVRWAGFEKRLWPSVLTELRDAERLTEKNRRLTLTMCVNYGARAELLEATRRIARRSQAGELDLTRLTEKQFERELLTAGLGDVDLFLRSSGEQRISNFLLWQTAYAELLFVDELWPDFRRETLWNAILQYGGRQRRFGAAVDSPVNQPRSQVK